VKFTDVNQTSIYLYTLCSCTDYEHALEL